MKKLPIIATLALAIGASVSLAHNNSNSAKAATTAGTFTYTFGDYSAFSSWGTSYGAKTLTYDEATVAFTAANRSTATVTTCPVTKANNTTLSLVTTGYKITSFSATFVQWSTKTVSMKVYTGANAQGTQLFSCSSQALTSIPETTISTSGVTSLFFNKTDSNQLGWKSITITVAVDDTPVVDSVSLPDASGNLMVGKTKTLTATANGSVTWTSSNEAVATIAGSGTNNTTGTITALAAGTTTITAKNGTASATYALTVVEGLAHAGTLADPLSVADARKAIDYSALTSGSRYYVKGIVSNVDYAWSSKILSYTIKDNSSDTDSIYCYKANAYVNPELAVGDEVITSTTASKFGIYSSKYELNTCDIYNPITGITATLKNPITLKGYKLVPSDLNVTVTYKHGSVVVTDGTGVKVNNATEYVLPDADNEVTVSYSSGAPELQGTNTGSTTVNINGLVDLTLQSIALSGSLTKTSYLSSDTKWDLAGLSFKGTYNTGDVLDYQLDDENATVTTDPAAPALGVTKLTVNVTYKEKMTSETYDVEVFKARPDVLEEVAIYNFNGVETTLKSGDAVTKGLLDSACTSESNPLQSVSATKVTYGNATGGAFTGGDLIKYGTSSASGELKLTFAAGTKINTVVVYAHAWETAKTPEGKIVVNGDTDNAQAPSNDGTFQALTFKLSASTNVITVSTSTKRAYIQKIELYENVAYEADGQALFNFVDNYMHMDYTEDQGLCAGADGYYSVAEAEYGKLSNKQKSLFCTNAAFTAEHARLVAWAAANGKVFDENYDLVSAAKISGISSTDSSSMVVVIVSILCITTLGAAIIIKKRKFN